MYLFYDEVSGSHNVTEEWIVSSASYVLYSNTGQRITEHHVMNNFIWGCPALIYTLINNALEPVTHCDWYTPLEQATTQVLENALQHMEQNENDTDLQIVTWSGYDYISTTLSEFPQLKVSQQLDKPYSKLYDAAITQGVTLTSLSPKDRIEAIIQLYFSSIKKLT